MQGIKSPVEKAIDPIVSGDYKSVGIISSFLWSSLFDLASFVMGFIWINFNREKGKSIVDKIVNFSRRVFFGYKKIKNIRNEFERSELSSKEYVTHPVDMERLRKFGARLIAVSSSIQNQSNSNDVLYPIKLVLAKLQILDSTVEVHDVDKYLNKNTKVGILKSEVKKDEVVNPILAVMELEELFYKDSSGNSYILNKDNEVAFDMVAYLVNNPYVVENSNIREYYPTAIEHKKDSYFESSDTDQNNN